MTAGREPAPGAAPRGFWDDVALSGRKLRIAAGGSPAGLHATGAAQEGPLILWRADGPACELPVLRGARVLERVSTPLQWEQTVVIDDLEVRERILVAWDAPVCILEWSATGRAGEAMLAWRIAVEGDGGPPTCESTGRALTFTWPSGHVLAATFEEPPADLQVRRVADSLEVGATLRLGATTPVRLGIVAVAGPGELERVRVASLRSTDVRAARRARLARLHVDGLAVSTEDAACDAAFDRAKLALAASPPRPAVGLAGLRDALARLAIGDAAAVRSLLHVSLGDPARSMVDGALQLLLAGHYLAWTGDVAGIRAGWPALRERSRALASVSNPDFDRGLRAGALAALVHVAEGIGRSAEALELRREARDAVTGAATVESLRAVPGWPERDGAGALPAFADRPGRSTAADLLCELVFDVLGVEPDAMRGRLRIRPRPPADPDRLAVRNLEVGAAALSFRFERRGRVFCMAVVQDRGRTPLTLLLEPELPGRLVAARVDGHQAELGPLVLGSHTRVPVQLVLDHERRLELEMEPDSRQGTGSRVG